MNPKAVFVAGKPAMKLGTLLVITDLHIGITRDIAEKGIRIPSQVRKMASRINGLGKITGTSVLLILGDVKHKIPAISWQEQREIPEFFSLLGFRKIIVVKGNHDGRIEQLVPENVAVAKAYTHGDFAFTHGHRRIKTSRKTIVMGHNQPHVKFRDELGASYVEPVWVKGPLKGGYNGKKLIIVPAFNELAGAALVNKDEFLGPIARCIDTGKAHCYLLDGTDLGTIKDLALT